MGCQQTRKSRTRCDYCTRKSGSMLRISIWHKVTQAAGAWSTKIQYLWLLASTSLYPVNTRLFHMTFAAWKMTYAVFLQTISSIAPVHASWSRVTFVSSSYSSFGLDLAFCAAYFSAAFSGDIVVPRKSSYILVSHKLSWKETREQRTQMVKYTWEKLYFIPQAWWWMSW